MIAYRGGPFFDPTIAAGGLAGLAGTSRHLRAGSRGLLVVESGSAPPSPGTRTIAGSRLGEIIQASISQSSRM